MARPKKEAQVTYRQVPAIVPQNVSIEAVIQNAIDKGVAVETMERLLAMRRELKAEASKEAYDRAMAAFQAECPTIVKTKSVHTSSGDLAYKYAPIESIVQQVAPYLQRHGFSYSTGMELKENGVRVVVKVTHELGHSEESAMEVPFGTKTPVMSDTQVTAAAQTFAKRYAFCNAFGILTGDEDNDARPTPPMPSYEVKRAIPAADDEAGGAVIQMEPEPFKYDKPLPDKIDNRGYADAPKREEDKQFLEKDEIETVQKEKIKELMAQLGHKPATPLKVFQVTKVRMSVGLLPQPQNYPLIIAKLEKLADKEDSLGQAIKK